MKWFVIYRAFDKFTILWKLGSIKNGFMAKQRKVGLNILDFVSR